MRVNPLVVGAVLLFFTAGCPSASDTSSDLGGSDQAGPGSDAGDGGPPNGGGCVASGTPAQVSRDTRVRMKLPLVAWDGTTTMVAWSVYPAAFDRSVWAQVSSSAVVAHGTFASGIDTSTAQLFSVGAKVYLFQPGSALYAFNGTSWDTIAFKAQRIVVSGSHILGISPGITNGATAIIYDGTTVSAPQMITNYKFGDAAADGSGGFGVVNYNASGGGTAMLYFVSYNGSTWSSETSIGTQNVPDSVQGVNLAHSSALWCVAVRFQLAGPAAWVQSGGAWTSSAPGLSSYNFGGLAGNNGTFAMSTLDGAVSIYNGAWHKTAVTSFSSAVELAPFGNGYVLVAKDFMNGSANAALFDGAMWSMSQGIGSGAPGPISVSGSTIAVGTQSGYAAIYEGGSWSSGSVIAAPFDAPAVLVEGTNVVAAVPAAGVIDASTHPQGGPWGPALALPAYATSGPVLTGALAHAANGHALAVWGQYQDGNIGSFASEYDGCGWGAPVSLTLGSAQFATVAANGSTFVVADQTLGQVATWTGSGLSSPTKLGNGVMVASDGNNFVAAWVGVGASCVAASSSDGQSWSAPQTVDASAPPLAIAGGPAGVLVSTVASQMVKGRLWQGGTWSAAATLSSPSNGSTYSCQGSVANTTALIACISATQLDAQLYSGGAWSDLPAGPPVAFVLGSDGTDYRMDPVNGLTSRVLHNGTWSAPIMNTALLVNILGVAGRSGSWSALGLDQMNRYARASASGAVGYTSASAVLPTPIMQAYSIKPFVNQPGSTDAVLVDGSPTYQGVSVLDIVLGL